MDTWLTVLILIGRILFVALFATSAVAHLTKTKMLAGYAQSRGVPIATAATIVTGLMLVASTISLLLGIWMDLGALLLVVFLLGTSFLIHHFWTETDPQARQADQTHFFKDLALAGASLMLFALFIHAGDDLGWTLTGPLFG